jgi:hypothetical protein
MRALALALVLVACTSAKESTKEAPAAAPAKSPAPEPAPKPAPGTGPGPAAPTSGAITAAEAAAIAARSGSAGDSPARAAPADDSRCETDDDCGLTRVGLAENACCPMLCTPRVVTKARAAELHARIATCSAGRTCPQPMCRPPRERVTPACVEHLCVAQVYVDAGEQ